MASSTRNAQHGDLWEDPEAALMFVVTIIFFIYMALVNPEPELIAVWVPTVLWAGSMLVLGKKAIDRCIR